MDLQQTVQDLAEAWVAASTDTSFSRTQLQVYGSGSQEEGEEGEEPSTSGEGDFGSNPVTASSPPPGMSGGADNNLSSSHSRKRKQSSPQPLREGAEAAAPATTPSPAGRSPPQVNKKVKDEGGKMLPVHCVVEVLDSIPRVPAKGGEGSRKGEREEEEGTKKKEGYAIVPSSLQLRELVRVALSKLDFPLEKARNATGVIQVRNWKALPFSAITDNQQASVGKLFGDLLSHITLKISILASDAVKPNAASLDEPRVIKSCGLYGLSASSILRRGLDGIGGGMMLSRKGKPGDGRGFGRLHSAHELRIKLLQILEKRGPTLLVSHGCPFSQITVSQILQGKYNKPISVEKIQAFYQWYNIYAGLTDNTLLPADKVDSSSLPRLSSRHWRAPRTLFNPRIELPKLLQWYRQNPRPGRIMMESFLAELNASDFRKNGTPLQYSSIVVWFKNARVKYRHLLRSSAIAQMREDIGYSSDKSSSRPNDESQECNEEEEEEEERGDEEEMVLEEKVIQEEEKVVEEEKKAPSSEAKGPSRSSAKCPARNSAKSPVRSPAKSPMMTYELKEEPVEEVPGNENLHAVATSLAKPVILPSLLHMQARPHLQPVSIVSNGLIVPSRLPNGSHQSEAALQVPDLRKIASGFGISLTPEMAAAAHGMPIPSMAHAQYLHSLELMHKEHSALRMDYRNGAISVPKPAPAPLTVVSTSQQQRTPTTQSSRPAKQQETPKSAKSSPTTSTGGSPHPRVPRKRFTIDPTFEVPKLQSWFAVDPRPDRNAIERYVEELNSSEWRRHQPKYNSRVVYVWFKNARAKYSKMQSPSADMDPSMMRMHHEMEIKVEGSADMDASMMRMHRDVELAVAEDL